MSEMRRAEAPNKRIIIAGGGTIGKGLAKSAEKKFSVKIIAKEGVFCEPASAASVAGLIKNKI